MNSQQLAQARTLSGVDPFRAPHAASGAWTTPDAVEASWFDAPASSRRPSRMPASAPASSAPSIGDRDADRWFR